MNRRLLFIISVVILSVAMGMLLVGIFWLVYPYKPLEFKDDLFPVLNKEVKRDEMLQYKVDYCKYYDLSASLSRTFTNEIVYTIPTMVTSREVGCHSRVVGLIVPDHLPLGSYHLNNVYVYQVNPLRTIVIKHSTEQFTVTE